MSFANSSTIDYKKIIKLGLAGQLVFPDFQKDIVGLCVHT